MDALPKESKPPPWGLGRKYSSLTRWSRQSDESEMAFADESSNNMPLTRTRRTIQLVATTLICVSAAYFVVQVSSHTSGFDSQRSRAAPPSLQRPVSTEPAIMAPSSPVHTPTPLVGPPTPRVVPSPGPSPPAPLGPPTAWLLPPPPSSPTPSSQSSITSASSPSARGTGSRGLESQVVPW